MIHFFNEDISFVLKNKRKIKAVMGQLMAHYRMIDFEINYIFCSDEYLLKINQDYLQHDYYTDIITFDNSIVAGEILSDIYISVDRVKENATNNKVDFEHEMHRVMIHGVLHLCGLKDKTPAEQKEMHRCEDNWLMHFQEQ